MTKSLSKTPAPPKDRIYGSKVNPKGSASSEKSAKSIKFDAKTIASLTTKLKEFKETHNTKKVSLSDLKAVYRRGLGAYSSSHRPTISGGKPNSRNAWAMARVNAFLRKAGGGEYKKAYVQDDDLLKYADGGDVGQHIKCRRCGWEWNTKDSEEFDKYVCHNCGFDNRTYYDKDVLAYNGGGVVKSFYEWYVDWYKGIKNEITILISLPNELQPFKENNVVIINKFKKERDDIKAYNYLQQMLNKADEFGITIYLQPTPIGNVKTKSELIDYYKKFGFELTPNLEFMKRLPRYKDGGEVDDKKKTYAKWKSLVNMSKGELERFYNSEDGKKAGLSSSEAKSQGISSGRESARWIMKMKDTRVADWTPQMWKWANKQISFISRMSGNKGGLYDDKGNKTRKHTSLLIWGHNPEKKSSMQYEDGGTLPDIRMEDTIARIDDPRLADISYYKKGGTLELNEPILYHEVQGNFFIGKNTIYMWLYDDPNATSKLQSGEYDWVFFQPTSIYQASQKGFVPPLLRQWHKKFQKNMKGSEHLMAILKAWYDEEEKKMYILMMTTHPKFRKKGIMAKMIKDLREEFNLSQDDIIFDKPTDMGKAFMEAKKFDEGGALTEYTLWGVKKGEPDYMEDLLYVSNAKENFDKVKQMASKDGYDRFRVSKVDMMEKPDFTKAIKKEDGGVLLPNNILELLKEKKKLDEKSNELSYKLNEIANQDDRPMGLVSEKIKQSNEFKKAKSDFNVAFEKLRDFNSSPKGKELQKYLSKLDRMDRMKITKMKFDEGGAINQQINSNIMDEIKFNQLPHIDTIIKGDKVIIKESVFTGNIDNPKHMGERYIHCEILEDGGMLNSLNLKVINSVGVNAMLKGQKITRPINNLLTKGRKVLSNATTSFKDGGLNPDNKNVKEYFAHDMGNAGGVLVGKRHSEGGIKAINKGTGQPLEMEGGEVVITRGAVSNPKKYKFNGNEMTTREILSKLNVDGGGVSFAEGGDVPDKMTCGCDKMDFGGTTMSVQDFVQRSDSEYQEDRLRMGIEKERKDHYDTLSKLNAGTITIQQALNEIAKKEMKLDTNYPFGE